jgi:DNA-binding NtrC family response regulator
MSAPLLVAKRPGKVLVIEDDEHVRGLLQRVLAGAGHRVTLCSTGTDGLAQLSQARFDLVLIDKNLPDVDGIEVLRQLHDGQPQTQSIVITGFPTADTRLVAEGLGAWAYLVKPFGLVDLLAACDAAIDHGLPAPAAPLNPSRSVLVIDDDSSVIELVRRVLSRAGYSVHSALTVEAALEILGKAPVDLLLVDKNLPAISGFEVIVQARKLRPGVAAVMMTAALDVENVGHVELQGFIMKPFGHVRQLVEVVSHALDGVRPN